MGVNDLPSVGYAMFNNNVRDRNVALAGWYVAFRHGKGCVWECRKPSFCHLKTAFHLHKRLWRSCVAVFWDKSWLILFLKGTMPDAVACKRCLFSGCHANDILLNLFAVCCECDIVIFHALRGGACLFDKTKRNGGTTNVPPFLWFMVFSCLNIRHPQPRLRRRGQGLPGFPLLSCGSFLR